MVKLTHSHIANAIINWGARVLFILGVIVLSILSFVDSFELSPNVKNITILALVAAVLNYLVWDSFYSKQYEKQLMEDLNNEQYCIHKRYYEARRGWKYKDLQDKISEYNKNFVNAWIKDCEDITGLTEQEMKDCPYKKHSHKIILWRIKHHLYPKTGIRTPNDVLYVLSIGKSDSMKIHVKAEEHFRLANRIRKFIMVCVGCFLIASFAYTFITSGFSEAIVKLILNVAMLFMSLFFGSTTGIKGGKLKLSTAEIVSEKLEEWRGSTPTQEPYQEIKESKQTEDEVEKQNKSTIEIR